MKAVGMVPGRSEGFRAALRREAAATWRGRWSLLWLVSGLGVLVWVGWTPELGVFSLPFQVLCGLACWVPAWLCADLFSLRFRGNPEPLRQWEPWELGARAVGRLGIYSLWLLLWVGVFTGRTLVHELVVGGSGLTSPFPPEEQRHGWPALLTTWIAWIGVFFASSLPYAAGAALVSSLARSPRQWVVTPLVVLFGSMAACWVIWFFAGLIDPVSSPSWANPQGAMWAWGRGTPAELARFALWPNFCVGYYSAADIAGIIQRVFRYEPQWSFSYICLFATFAFGLYAAPLAFFVRRLARNRHRGSARPTRGGVRLLVAKG